MNGKLKRIAFIEIGIFCNIINVFTVTFDKFNMSLLNKMNHCLPFFKCFFFLLQIVLSVVITRTIRLKSLIEKQT